MNHWPARHCILWGGHFRSFFSRYWRRLSRYSASKWDKIVVIWKFCFVLRWCIMNHESWFDLPTSSNVSKQEAVVWGGPTLTALNGKTPDIPSPQLSRTQLLPHILHQQISQAQFPNTISLTTAEQCIQRILALAARRWSWYRGPLLASRKAVYIAWLSFLNTLTKVTARMSFRRSAPKDFVEWRGLWI